MHSLLILSLVFSQFASKQEALAARKAPTATLQVGSAQWKMTITVDGKVVHTARDHSNVTTLGVAANKPHHVVFTHPNGTKHEEDVTLAPGETKKVWFSIPEVDDGKRPAMSDADAIRLLSSGGSCDRIASCQPVTCECATEKQVVKVCRSGQCLIGADACRQACGN